MSSDYDIHVVSAPTHERVLVRCSSGMPRGGRWSPDGTKRWRVAADDLARAGNLLG
jgi:hypothetical protein